MDILVDGLAKRYGYSWIIKDFSHHFQSQSVTAISGPNGSGKSTLMKMLSTYLPPSKGTIKFDSKNVMKSDEVVQHLSFVAPYTDIVQEFSLKEMFDFHQKFKSWRAPISYSDFKEILGLPAQKGKQIQYFSSGMNQRLQLALAILSDTSILLLDEPTSYLDSKAKRWTYDLLRNHLEGRLVVIASNDSEDFEFADSILEINN